MDLVYVVKLYDKIQCQNDFFLILCENDFFWEKKKFLLIYVFTANAEMSRNQKNALVGKSFFSSTLSQQKKRSRQYRLTFLRLFQGPPLRNGRFEGHKQVTTTKDTRGAVMVLTRQNDTFSEKCYFRWGHTTAAQWHQPSIIIY